MPVECAIAVETLVQIGTFSGIRKPHDESSTSKKWIEAQSRAPEANGYSQQAGLGNKRAASGGRPFQS